MTCRINSCERTAQLNLVIHDMDDDYTCNTPVCGACAVEQLAIGKELDPEEEDQARWIEELVD